MRRRREMMNLIILLTISVMKKSNKNMRESLFTLHLSRNIDR